MSLTTSICLTVLPEMLNLNSASKPWCHLVLTFKSPRRDVKKYPWCATR